MPRRMSCSLTTPQVEDRSKTVTRRHVDSWLTLSVGDHLTLIEKGMGLKKGEKQRVLAEVEIISVRIEQIGLIDQPGELAAEGFPNMRPWEFRSMWAAANGYSPHVDNPSTMCRRIEWRYL